MVKHDNCNHSLINSVIRTQTWCIFSGLSLADISVISVVALPLYLEDLNDRSEHYIFGDIAAAADFETTAQWTTKQTVVDAKHQSLLDQSSTYRVADAVLSSIGESHCASIDEGSYVRSIASRPFTTHVSESTSVTTVDDNILQQLESRYNGFTLHTPMQCQTNGDVLENLVTHDNNDFDPQAEDDEILYCCKGCGEILGDGKVLELGKKQ